MKTPTAERPHPHWDGVQRSYKFENGYGASVVRAGSGGAFSGSYGASQGLWELAVMKSYGPGPFDFKITYDTPITDDVLGHLTEDDVDRILGEIEALAPIEATA